MKLKLAIATGMKLKLASSVLAETFSKWNEHKAIRLGAALAYFGIFAIAPVLIIAIDIAGLVYGRAAAEGNIVSSISGVVGSSTAQFVQGLIQSVSQPGAGVIAAVVGVTGIVLGSAGLFFQLKDALNTVWEVAPKPGYRLVDMIRDNALSFAMVLGLGVFMLASLLFTAGVSAVGSFLGSAAPSSETVWQLVDFGLSFGLAALLFACIFKILPDVRVPWGDVWPGAILTALLFAVAQVALSVIIRLVNPGLAFGAAGALVVILVWVDLVSLILLFGAEFIRVYSRRFGSRAQPKAYAEALTAEARAAQGIPAKETNPETRHDQPAISTKPLCRRATFQNASLVQLLHLFRARPRV